MPKFLEISSNLRLPIDFVTKTAAILAQRRKGKTYTASVFAEELVAAKQPFVALDPTGAWWGLRSSLDGQSPGLPVIVLGGQHGDVPLERTGGKLVADLVVDEPGYYVIDFSLFESGEAERQFAVDFAERLYRAKGQAGKDFPLHLFVDEADRFIPQNLRKGSTETSARLLGAFEAIVRRGGLRGLGTTLISQRAAIVNKNVLEMLDVLIALRTVGPNDRDAVLGYVSAHGSEIEVKTLKASLASLDIGEAWIWEPGADPALFERIKIRERRTFNSSATPKLGEKRAEPKRLAPVDIAALQKRMAETIERAKADDPKALRAEIAELKRQLAKPAGALKPERVEVPTFSEEEFGALFESVSSEIDAALARASEAKATVGRALVSYRQQQRAAVKAGTEASPIAQAPRSAEPARSPPDLLVFRGERSPEVGTGGLSRIMTVLAQRPVGMTVRQIGLRAGLSSQSGTFSTYLSKARTAGWIEGKPAIRLTEAGFAALGTFTPLPTGNGLLEYWLNELGGRGGAARLLRAFADAYPATLSNIDVGGRCGLSHASGTFSTYMSRLRGLKLIEGERGAFRASSELFE